MKQREQAYDIMKGIAILLMMAAHLVWNDGLPKQKIYSFHMPLFFILAGMFAKNIEAISSFKDYTRKNAKRLLRPYIVTFLMLCACGAVQSMAKHDSSYLLRQLFSMLTASADGWKSDWGLIYAGPMWFLVALFWIRELFYGIQRACMRVPKYKDELIVGICVALSVLSVLIRPLSPALPLSILPAFTSIAFYAVGYYIKRHSQPWWIYGLCVLAWPIAVMYSGVDLASCHLGIYPLSFLGACGGTYIVNLLCKGIVKIHELLNSINIKHHTCHIPSPLSWCGVYSLPILCMHTFEMHSDIYYTVMCRLLITCERAWGGVIAILFVWVIIRIPYLKEVYK